jgi:DNA polymerase IV (DinB-like DNA polymerase)
MDLDYFYAQCEEVSNPTFQGKPVVVCVYSGRTEDSGVVSTCNYKARSYGVKAGIPIIRAKKLLRGTDAAFVQMNRAHYEEVSNRIMDIIEPFGNPFEAAGIDEAYLDLTSKTSGDFELAKQIAKDMKNVILDQVHITCTIGVAPNKLLAKIASDRNKPNGLTIITPEDVNSFLGDLALSAIPRVGMKTEGKLHEMKIATISQLAALDVRVLHETFGKSLGTFLYRAARGEDDEPVEPRERPTQFSRIATLKNDTHDVSEISPLLEELAHSATQKLAAKAMVCRTISIIAILQDLSIHSKSKTLESPTCDERTTAQASRDLLEQFLQSKPNAQVRRIGVRLSGLEMESESGQTDISKFLQH